MKQVLILGGPGVGKTHYGVVQLEHWFARKGGFQVLSRPEDLTVFAEARRALREGRAAAHTSSPYATVSICVRASDSTQLELAWPDYSGEQVDRIFEDRKLNAEWLERVTAAEAWLLLIRPRLIERAEDILTAGPAVDRSSKAREASHPTPKTWDHGARLVELLQILLDAAGQPELGATSQPRLGLLLSCWDELESSDEIPQRVLRATLPMLAAFIENRWSPEARSVWGLSALGRSLSNDKTDAEYADSGPAENGYVLRADGARCQALDEPIEWILRKK
jgi:Double-GTPase 1